MPYCQLTDGTKLYFQVFGQELDTSTDILKTKPTIIGLHGGPNADHTFHIPFFERCSDFAQVVLLDHRGCGRSKCTNSNKWHLKQWADDVANFCHQLNLIKPYICGISFGGYVAMQHAIKYSNDISGTILIDTEGKFDKQELFDAFEKFGDITIRQIAEKHYNNPERTNSDDFIKHCVPLFSQKRFPTEWFQHCIVNHALLKHFETNELFTFNLLPELHKLTCPILYLSGTTNPVHRQNSATYTAQAMTDAEVTLHFLDNMGFTTVDDPEWVVKRVSNFIKKYTD